MYSDLYCTKCDNFSPKCINTLTTAGVDFYPKHTLNAYYKMGIYHRELNFYEFA